MDRFPPYRRHESDRPITTGPQSKSGSSGSDQSYESDTFLGANLPSFDANHFKIIPNPVPHGLFLIGAGLLAILMAIVFVLFSLVSPDTIKVAANAFTRGVHTLALGFKVLLGGKDPGQIESSGLALPPLNSLPVSMADQDRLDHPLSEEDEDEKENGPACLVIDSWAIGLILAHVEAHPSSICYG